MNYRKWFRIISSPKKIMNRRKERKLLKDASGLIHVGANRGQEKDKYNQYNLNVIWVEPIPELFEQLLNNTKNFKKQKSFKALITDIDHQDYEFNVANNNGASSSILELKEHKEIWPHVYYDRTISLKSITLASLIIQENIDMNQYQGLIMDTQGSELLVLKGAVPLLKYFKFIKTEVADFESYEGCCQLSDINDFMIANGFKEYNRKPFGKPTKTGGRYFNITYIRQFL